MSNEAGTGTGLYVHVPFCSSICPYCDFAVTRDEPGRRARFVEALLTEIALRAAPETACDTLYFGGGTPSRLAPADVAGIRGALDERGWLARDRRIFLEVNPEDASRERLAGWREAGVETLSLGVQSLDDAELRFLGRRHSADDARRAFHEARSAGFDTVSIDLMFGFPEQSETDWLRALDAVVALAPDHVSSYQLTIHEGTMFGRRAREGTLVEASEDRQAALFRLTHERLADAGYDGYEVSNFARAPGHRSRHNEKYWAHVPYVGLGPSAHSFDGASRCWNERSFFDWEKKVSAGAVPESGSELLDGDALRLETLMLRLRTRDGLDLDDFERRFGIDLRERAGALLDRCVSEGLVTLSGERLLPTLDGLAIADGLARSFFDALALERR